MGKGRPAQPPARVPVFETNRSHGANRTRGRASSCGQRWGTDLVEIGGVGTAGSCDSLEEGLGTFWGQGPVGGRNENVAT